MTWFEPLTSSVIRDALPTEPPNREGIYEHYRFALIRILFDAKFMRKRP